MFNILICSRGGQSVSPLARAGWCRCGTRGGSNSIIITIITITIITITIIIMSLPQVGAGGGGGQEAESARPRGAAQGDPADPHPAVPQVQEQHRGELILGEPLLSALSWEPLILELHYLPSDPLLSSYHVITNSVISNLFQSFQTSLPPPQPTI